MHGILDYDSALAYIHSLEGRGWRMGLDRMREFCRRLDVDRALGQSSPRFVHVAGTNGKGSTTAFAQAVLHASQAKVGGYFSPFVFDIRERIQTNCRMISRSDFARLVQQIKPVAESFEESEFGQVTEFEFKTAMGFKHWSETSCEWVALEVGMGGRLDATNVVQPASCGIVSIGLDHTAILGSTLEEIAKEKAGIIKADTPVVAGSMPEEAIRVVRSEAEAIGCEIFEFGAAWTLEGYTLKSPWRSVEMPEPGIPGLHALHNAGMAVCLLDAAGAKISSKDIQEGIASARLPGRGQTVFMGPNEFLLDGAHNAESAASLVSWLVARHGDRPLVLLTGMLSGHDPTTFFQPFRGKLKYVVATSIDFHRALSADDVAQAARSTGAATESVFDTAEAVRRSIELAEGSALIVVSGSFYLVGAVGALIGASGTMEQGTTADTERRSPHRESLATGE